MFENDKNYNKDNKNLTKYMKFCVFWSLYLIAAHFIIPPTDNMYIAAAAIIITLVLSAYTTRYSEERDAKKEDAPWELPPQ